VPVILLLAAAAILGCVVLAALGRAGEMAAFPSDSPPLRLDDLTAADVIARSVTARDVEIATLRRELAELRARWEPRQ